MEALESFMRRFAFRKEGGFLVGVEREAFLVNSCGVIVPRAAEVIERINSGPETAWRPLIGYELSACQVETRTHPCPIGDIETALLEPEQGLQEVLRSCGLSLLHQEVAPATMPLDVYPDPSGRYQRITRDMPCHILQAACRVTGTHIHIGMPDHETALRVYNRVIKDCLTLCELGDSSGGERLSIYRIMAPEADPPAYAGWDDFYEMATAKGFAEDPRKCWTLIRISVHGTIEFRMFGTTSSLERIKHWAYTCYSRCLEAAS